MTSTTKRQRTLLIAEPGRGHPLAARLVEKRLSPTHRVIVLTCDPKDLRAAIDDPQTFERLHARFAPHDRVDVVASDAAAWLTLQIAGLEPARVNRMVLCGPRLPRPDLMSRGDLTQRLALVSAPTLVMAGLSTRAAWRDARLVASTVATARLSRMPCLGQPWPLRSPHEAANIIATFLMSRPQSSQ